MIIDNNPDNREGSPVSGDVSVTRTLPILIDLDQEDQDILAARQSILPWNALQSYISSPAASIPVLYKQLEKILGMTIFMQDIAFWNQMVDGVKGDNMVAFNSLHARYISTDVSQSVSLFPPLFAHEPVL